MFGSYREAIEILRHLFYTSTDPEEGKALTKAIVAIQSAWHDEEKAFSRAYDLKPADELKNDGEVH